MPRLDHVVSGRKRRQVEAPVRPRHRVVRVTQHADVGGHPPMNVAADRDHDLRRAEASRALHVHGLACIEAALLTGGGVDVVKQAVAVTNRDVLVRHHPQHMREIHTAVLIQERGARNRELQALQPLLDVYEDVGKRAVAHDDVLGHGRCGVLVRAHRLGTHVDDVHRRSLTLERDGTGDVACRCRIHGVLHHRAAAFGCPPPRLPRHRPRSPRPGAPRARASSPSVFLFDPTCFLRCFEWFGLSILIRTLLPAHHPPAPASAPCPRQRCRAPP